MEGLGPVKQLYAIVEDTELCNVYEEYLVGCFAWENFGFWFEVESFKKSESEDEMKKQATLIYQKFLEIGCVFELGDLQPCVRNAIEKKLETPTLSMYDTLQKRVMRSLALSTLGDFFEDDIYQIYMASQAPAGSKKKVKSIKHASPALQGVFKEEAAIAGNVAAETPQGFLCHFAS